MDSVSIMIAHQGSSLEVSTIINCYRQKLPNFRLSCVWESTHQRALNFDENFIDIATGVDHLADYYHLIIFSSYSSLLV